MNPNTSCISGILYGTMTMELGGKVNIECEKNNLQAELDFKLKVMCTACGRECMELEWGSPSFCVRQSAPKENNWGRLLCIPIGQTGPRERTVLPAGYTAQPASLSPLVLMEWWQTL